MLGWEFPPFISGGLGTACYGLTKAMDELGIKVTFVLPKIVGDNYSTHVDLLTPGSTNEKTFKFADKLRNTTFCAVDSSLQPYSTEETYQSRINQALNRKKQMGTAGGLTYELAGEMNYAGDMYTEVHRYAAVVAELATHKQFDIVHAHDWMTYPAGTVVAAMSGKPFVIHVHSTEFDRSGENINQMIYDIERKAMHAADKIIAVSNFTRNIMIIYPRNTSCLPDTIVTIINYVIISDD